MKYFQFPSLVAVIALTGAGPSAYTPAPPPHFKLLEPISWLIESEARGDPQKAGPCGGTNADWGKESYVVNQAKGGANQHMKLQETVFHPGHFRVALAVNSMTELPPDPVVTTRIDSTRAGNPPMSVSAVIQSPAQAPVLADGLFPRTQRPAALETFEADIMLPNINCDHCILQVIQFMSAHGLNNPGGYSYHHCAIMHITADPSKPLDTRWPAQRQSD